MEEKDIKELIERLTSNKTVLESAMRAYEAELANKDSIYNREGLQERYESIKKEIAEIEEKLKNLQ